MLENHGDFRKLEELKQKLTTPGSETEIISLLKEFGVDVESLKQSLNSTESSVSKTFRASQSRMSLSSSISFDDIDDQPNIGQLGEEFVYDKLVRKFGAERVLWMNQEGRRKIPMILKFSKI